MRYERETTEPLVGELDSSSVLPMEFGGNVILGYARS